MEEWRKRVTIDEAIVGGHPVIKGTRVPLQVIVGSLSSGATVEDVCEDYGVTREDVLAALAFAAEAIAKPQHAISG